MGTFVGHIIPGLALTIVGIWHTINTIRAYHLSSKFLSRLWYPFNKYKKLELVFILSFCILAIVMQVLDFPLLQFAFKLNNFEHATMFLHLAIFAAFVLFSELGRSSESLSSFIGILLVSVFCQELFLLHFHSTDHIGVEGHYHWLLQLIVSISLGAALAMTIFPASFPVALVLSVSVVFQGFWFMNMAFMLWVPKFVPHGCFVQLTDMAHGAVLCSSHDADARARALANLQFSWILSAILTFTGIICVILASEVTPRSLLTEYEQLQSRAADVSTVTDTDCFKQAPLCGAATC
ncbi:hypothetical protein Ancab_027477 [Ancistrocladus abbreviatus]